MRVFHNTVSRCFQTGVWVKTSFHVTRTHLSIIADFNKAVIWVVSTRSLVSMSSSHYISPLVTALRAPITIGITVIFMFPSFFDSVARSTYLSFSLISFNFTLWSDRTAKFTILQVLFLMLIIKKSGRLAEIRWSVCISKHQKEFLRLLFQNGFRVMRRPFVRMDKSKLLAQFTVEHLSHPVVYQPYSLSVLVCCIHSLCD